MLDFGDLLETVTRRRVTGTKQTPRGKVLPAGTSDQVIQCLVQPHRGNLQYELEGTLQSVTEALYCNLVPVPGAPAPTDIQYLDTIIRAGGRQCRVAFVADEGGQGDHLKVFLVAVTSGGAGDDGDILPVSASGGVVPSAPPLQSQIDVLTAQIEELMSKASAPTSLPPQRLYFDASGTTGHIAPSATMQVPAPPAGVTSQIVFVKPSAAGQSLVLPDVSNPANGGNPCTVRAVVVAGSLFPLASVQGFTPSGGGAQQTINLAPIYAPNDNTMSATANNDGENSFLPASATDWESA